ncbi:MAG: riboflavin biosynthesis protein RibF [Clostridia bacterium]|nr:riboflavin biosynthesis protein RibF [Clostridia bacterium]
MANRLKTVLALGYFDSVHIGHRKVIEAAFSVAENATVTVFTFKGNLKAELFGKNEKYVYGAKEREEILRQAGVENVWFAPVTKEFLSTDKDEFLRFVAEKFDVSCFVCGKDYRFGKGGAGNAYDVKKFAESRGVGAIIVDDVISDGEKVSTSRIKTLLAAGDIEAANELLGRNFSATGRVVAGRKEGRILGFPTANIETDPQKQYVKKGVYRGRAQIDGKEYKAVINYGEKPTFGIDTPSLEAYIIGYAGDAYGKKITVSFDGFLRETAKFSGEKELSERIKKDVEITEKLS